MQTFTLITNHSWLYIDKIDHYPNQNGSQACRNLLKNIQQQLNIKAPLHTEKFPYYFMCQNRIYFVCFSHSKQQIAVLLSKSANIGVDIEDKIIKNTLIERFFAKNEQQWLVNMPENQQNLAKTLLWTLKESFVKSSSNSDILLTNVLKTDFLDLYGEENLQKLLKIHQQEIVFFFFDKSMSYVGFLPNFSCGFIIQIE